MKPKVSRSDLDWLTPNQLSTSLAVAAETNEPLAVALAISAFAGLRHAEIKQLTWEDLHLDEIRVYSDFCRGGSRNVPIFGNLRAWLTAYRKSEGPLIEVSEAVWRNQVKSFSKQVAFTSPIFTAARFSFARHFYGLSKDVLMTCRLLGSPAPSPWAERLLSIQPNDDDVIGYWRIVPPTARP